MHPIRSTGVVGMARRKRDTGNVGDPFRSRVATSRPRQAAGRAEVGGGHSTAEAG